jgi:Na+-translocating ferredoxin:NAD+ oxidoreductase subunit B
MHTVVEPWCIGCELCVAPCPIDCIAMVPAQGEWNAELKRAAGARGQARAKRLKKIEVTAPEVDRKRILAEALERKKRA